MDQLISQISGLVESALGVAVAVDAQLMQVWLLVMQFFATIDLLREAILA